MGPLGIAPVHGTTRGSPTYGTHQTQQVDLLSQSEHGSAQGQLSHQGGRRFSARPGTSGINLAANLAVNHVNQGTEANSRKHSIGDSSGHGGVGGIGDGGTTMSANTGYGNNLARRPSNAQLYDSLSVSEHGYGTPMGRGLGLGLGGRGGGLAPSPLPALSFALPKQDKLLTRSASITNAVLKTFNEVHNTPSHTSTNNNILQHTLSYLQ